MGHDVAGHQLKAVQHFLTGRPVNRLDQETAVTAALLGKAVEAFDTVVGCTDNPGTVVPHELCNTFQRAIKGCLAPIGTLRVFAEVTARAHFDFLKGLVPVISQVAGNGQAPFVAINRLAVFCR